MAGNPLANDLNLTLFVACYNEEDNIVGTLDTILAALKGFDFSWEIIIIDDASTDRSVQVIEDYLAERPDLPIELFKRECNVGLGLNYIEAAFRGRGKYYRLVCGDNAEPRETLVTVFKQMGKADMVLFHHDVEGKALSRRIISRCYTWLVNLLSGYRIRYYNGMPLFQRYNVMRWHTNYHGFGFQADLVVRMLDIGSSYIEVPLKGNERKSGTSHALTLRNFLSVSHTLFDLFVRRLAGWRSWRRTGLRAPGMTLQRHVVSPKPGVETPESEMRSVPS